MPIPQEQIAVERLSAKERVLQTLSRWIVDGTLEPGERIYDEELSKYFHISRTPVREALQVLSEKRLVEVLPGRETRVAPIDPQELEQIYPMLAHLHGFAVKLAFPKITPQVLASLEEKNLFLAQMLKDHKQVNFKQMDRQFHQILVSLASNCYLEKYLDDLQLHADRAELQYFKWEGTQAQSIEDHRRIIAALRKGDCSEAVRAMEENWLITCRLLLERISQQDI